MTSWETIGRGPRPLRPLTRAILRKAADRGITDIGPTKICGLLYLLDIEHVKAFGSPVTDVEWRWLYHGPFDSYAAYGARDDEEIEELSASGPHDGSRYRALAGATYEIEERISLLLDSVLDVFGRRTAKAIKDYCYRSTTPMIQVQESGAQGDVLDLTVAGPEPSDAAVETIHSVVKSLDGYRGPGRVRASKALTDLIDETEPIRSRATQAILNRE